MLVTINNYLILRRFVRQNLLQNKSTILMSAAMNDTLDSIQWSFPQMELKFSEFSEFDK